MQQLPIFLALVSFGLAIFAVVKARRAIKLANAAIAAAEAIEVKYPRAVRE